MQSPQPLRTEFAVCYLVLVLRLSSIEFHAVWTTLRDVAKASLRAESVRASPEWLALRREFPDYDETQPYPIPRFVWSDFGPELLCTHLETVARKDYFKISCFPGQEYLSYTVDSATNYKRQWSTPERRHFVSSVRHHLSVLTLAARVGRAISATGVVHTCKTVSLSASCRVSWIPRISKLRPDDAQLYMRINMFSLMVELSYGDEVQTYKAGIVDQVGFKLTVALHECTESEWIGMIAYYFKEFSNPDAKPQPARKLELRRDASPHRKLNSLS